MLNFSKRIVNIFFLIIIFSLFVMSLFVHCEVNIHTYNHIRTIEHHRVFLYFMVTLLSAIMTLLLYALVNWIISKAGKQQKITTVIVVVCAVIIFVAGIFWIHFNDSIPIYDQATIYKEARKLAGYLLEPYDYAYMTFFKRQRGFTLLMSAALWIFGDAQTSVGILNVIGATALFVGICKIAANIVKDKSYAVFISFTLTFFYPIVIYTTFLYGTLLALTFSVWGFYAVVKFCETPNLRYAIISAASFSMGVLMHQSAAVAVVAGIIYLMVHIHKVNVLKNCITAAAVVLLIFLSLRLADAIYERLTGAPGGDSVPATATIYMGLNAETEDGGPGSQDGSFVYIFHENNEDGAATNRDAIGRIKLILLDYMTGKRSLDFFIRKTEYQWMDPTMGARKIIVTNDVNSGDPPNSEAFKQFYESSLRTIVFKASNIFMIMIYGFAAVAGIFTLCRKNDILEDKSIHFLIQLFFIGGFAFQLMWETLSRYCFPYFVVLIPEAIYGVHQLYHLVCNIRKGREYGENGKSVFDNTGL